MLLQPILLLGYDQGRPYYRYEFNNGAVYEYYAGRECFTRSCYRPPKGRTLRLVLKRLSLFQSWVRVTNTSIHVEPWYGTSTDFRRPRAIHYSHA